MFTDKSKAQTLTYTIYDYSSTSNSFKPENIMKNNPRDPNSRWTTTSNDSKQHITLKLSNDSIVTSITFGKFQKLHVCNIKNMKVFCYTSDEDNFVYNHNGTNICEEMLFPGQPACPSINTVNNPILIFKGGLKNDAFAEIFPMKYVDKNMFVVSRYIKICPIQAWGINFNYSLWYVKVEGFDAKDVISKCKTHNYFKITSECYEIINYFLREHRNYKTLEALKEERNINAEPHIKEVMRNLIEDDNFEELENVMCKAVDDGVVDRECYPVGIWTQVNEYGPEERGGHAMSIIGSKMFIHGGWNGKEEVGDMWVFDCDNVNWRLLPKINEKRSCHKMIFLPDQNQEPDKNKKYYNPNSLLFIGRFVQMNTSRRMNISIFDLDKETLRNFDFKWEIENIFDHQEFFINGKLHIFGGKVFLNNQIHFGSLYSLENNEFKIVTDDYVNSSEMKGRIGHSIIYFENIHHVDFEKFNSDKCDKPNISINKMLLAKRSLLIIGGVREKQIYKNITFIDLDTNTPYKLVDFPIEAENKIVHRSILIGERIFFLFCYEKNKHKIIDRLSCYIYNIYENVWTKIITEGRTPIARSAHSFGYSKVKNKFYLFAGNTGNETTQKRLNDLWTLEILSISNESLKMKVKFDVRKHKFLRLKDKDKKAAIEYLQNDVYNVVDHRCIHDVNCFKKLVLEIYKTKAPYKTQEIIDDLSKYFLDELKPTTTSLNQCIFK